MRVAEARLLAARAVHHAAKAFSVEMSARKPLLCRQRCHCPSTFVAAPAELQPLYQAAGSASSACRNPLYVHVRPSVAGRRTAARTRGVGRRPTSFRVDSCRHAQARAQLGSPPCRVAAQTCVLAAAAGPAGWDARLLQAAAPVACPSSAGGHAEGGLSFFMLTGARARAGDLTVLHDHGHAGARGRLVLLHDHGHAGARGKHRPERRQQLLNVHASLLRQAASISSSNWS